MLSKDDLLNRAFIDPMFAMRLVDFLTIEELSQIGIKINEENVDEWKVEKEWSRENIIEKLVIAAHLGKKDCGDEIISGPSWLFMECVAWLNILEDEELLPANVNYASEFFNDILYKYALNIENDE